MGVYAWIRENVRNAVLLGFNDAVEMIGPASPTSEMNEQLTSVLKQSPQLSLESSGAGTRALTSSATATVAARPKRKRLGRSLGDIQEGTTGDAK